MKNKVLVAVVSVVEVEVDETLSHKVNTEFAKEFVLDHVDIVTTDNSVKHIESLFSTHTINEVTKKNFLDSFKKKLAVDNMPKI